MPPLGEGVMDRRQFLVAVPCGAADWLEKLGMPEYAQRFAKNDIDFAILGA
jgi:SAM domain (Sterile alpha motif)